MARRKPTSHHMEVPETGYGGLVSDISVLVEQARHQAARSINGLLTATYWEVGRRIVEFEQKGRARAEYGEGLLKRLADDLAARHGRGFSSAISYRSGASTSAGRFAGGRLVSPRRGRPSQLPKTSRLREFGRHRLPNSDQRRSMCQRDRPRNPIEPRRSPRDRHSSLWRPPTSRLWSGPSPCPGHTTSG